MGVLRRRPSRQHLRSNLNSVRVKMPGDTAVEAPVGDNDKKIDEPVKTDKEAIVEEEKEAEATEEKKDEEKAGDAKEEGSKAAAPKKPGVHQKDFEEDMVYLFQFQRSPCIPSISPFCLKLESWLKLHGIKYMNVDHKCKFRSKKGMLPFIEINGEEIADSNMIIETLAAKFGKEMPAQLSAEQKNVRHAMVAMVENHLHWTMVHWRSRESDNILKGYKLDIQTMIGSKAPPSILNWVFKYMHCRKGMKKVKSQGLGVHSAEEIEQFGKSDLLVLSEMLGDKEFFFGDEPALLDLVVYAHVAQLVMVAAETSCPLRDYIEADCKNLVGLVSRMKDRCWGDLWDAATGEEMDLNPHIPKPEPPPEPEKEEEKKEEEKKEEQATTEKEEKKEEEKEKADEKKEGDEKKDEEKEKEKVEEKEPVDANKTSEEEKK